MNPFRPALDRLGFMRNGLARAGLETEPEAFLRDAAGPDGLAIHVAGEQALLRRSGEDATAVMPAGSLGEPIGDGAVALGWLSGRAVAAVPIDPERIDALKAGDPDLLAVDLRSIAVQGLVRPEELGMLAQAKSLLAWHARHRFCANCGTATASACGGLRRDCPGCAAQHFPRTDPVAIMLVAHGNRCLLGRQARFVPNSYSCLAGFISPGETLEDAVRREVKEEAGIEVGRVSYVASQPWPFVSSLMIGCFGEALTEEIVLDREELEDGRWFTRDEVESMLDHRHQAGLITPPPMAIAHLLIRSWVEAGR